MFILKPFFSANRNFVLFLERKYKKFFTGGRSYYNDFVCLVDNTLKSSNLPTVLEVGGVDRPLLKKSKNYTYCGMDIDSKPTHMNLYDKFTVQSVTTNIHDRYDIVFSITLLEHVENNKLSLNNIYDCLNHGGQTMHYVPSKYHPYAIITRLIGNRCQRFIIKHLRSDSLSETGYPAYFNLCSVNQMATYMQSIGFKDIECRTYYRAAEYFSFFIPLYLAVVLFERICQKFDIKTFASGFIIYAKK